MRNKAVLGMILSLLLTSIFIVTINIPAAEAPPGPPLPGVPAYFSLTPSQPVVKVGETFDIIVNISGVNVSWESVALDFEVAFLIPQFELVDVTEGPFMKQFATPPNTPENGTFFVATPGHEWPISYHSAFVGIILLPNATGQWTVFPEGNGTLATLTFEALEPGTYFFDLTIAEISVKDTSAQGYRSGCYITVVPQLHDVAVVSLEPSATETYPDHTVNLTVVAQNRGETPETFNVTTYRDTTPIGTQTVNSLAPSQNITLKFTWNTNGLALYTDYTISAEASTVPYEANTTNNILTNGNVKIKMQGDVNGDQKTDIRDIAQAAQSFGTYLTHPNWNPNADAYQDNKIDIRDLITIAKNFGKTYPTE